MISRALFFITLVSALSAHAASSMRLHSGSGSGVTVSADHSYSDSEKQTIELSGHVQIIYDQQYMSCDHAIVNRKTEEVTAEGNLVISSPQAYIEGDSATMSYRDNTGLIMNGFVKSGPVIFEGHVVKKTGPQTYDAENASFTACTTCPTAWTFSGSRIQAEIGGYAYIKHARLRVANVPTLWLPYLIVPLKSQRQTGLLIPSIDYNSNGGTAIGESFFYAISRSQDATIGTKYYTKRGLKGILNYRYMLTPTSEGELNTALIHDTVFSGQVANLGSAPAPSSKVNRYFISYNHSYDLPNGFTQKTKINFASDLLYPRDFPEEMLGAGDPALENRFSLTRNTERSHASADASYYINQLHANAIDTNSETVQRFPELRYDLIERPIASSGLLSGLLFNFHSDYANFTRDNLAWDDVTYRKDSNGTNVLDQNGAPIRDVVDRSRTATGGNVFDPGQDIIRTGQRIDLQPEISSPFRIANSLDVLPVLSFRHTQYSLNVTAPPGTDFDPTPYRQYVRGTVSLRTRFSRIYGDNTPPAEAPHPSVTNWSDNESRVADAPVLTAPPVVHADVYRHEIEPELVLDGQQDTHNATSADNVFLGSVARTPSFLDSQPISNSDFNGTRGVQFDYYDRLTNRNTLAAYISNRLVKKTWQADGTPVYRQIASLKIGESYDFDELKEQKRQQFEWSDLSALLDTRLEHFETNTLVQYFPYHGKTNTSSRVRFMDSLGRYLELNYVENYLITLNRDDALANHTQSVGFLAGFILKYVDFRGAVDVNPTDWNHSSFAVKSWSALMNIKPPGNCWGIILTLRQDIGQPLDYHLNFDYNFGGEGPKLAAAQ